MLEHQLEEATAPENPVSRRARALLTRGDEVESQGQCCVTQRVNARSVHAARESERLTRLGPVSGEEVLFPLGPHGPGKARPHYPEAPRLGLDAMECQKVAYKKTP